MKEKENAPLDFAESSGATDNQMFKDNNFIAAIQSEIQTLEKSFEENSIKTIKHTEILSTLLEQIQRIDFREEVGLTEETQKLAKKHYLVCCIENVLEAALQNNWGISRNHDFIYLYNGAYWSLFDNAEFEIFLGNAAERMGIDRYDARLYTFRQQLFKQFFAVANLPKPAQSNDVVFINLKNGTFEISMDKQILRAPDRRDFITYQLPFSYDENATCPMFEKYLNTVQPDLDRQKILAEYLGYLFIKPSTLKLEKTLLLYGSGANGKSVFFEIVNALLGGTENVSSYSLQNLTNENGYFRAMLANKLVNYASEINGKLETSIFKQLVSGEPVEARLPYGEPFTLINYAKLIFNCNELPKDVEQTQAYFRRFLIVPFDVTIPESEQDKELSKKIIENELSGVFKWILEGLKRLLSQKNFTYSEAVKKQIEMYKMQSDTVQVYLEEEGYEKSIEEFVEFKILFSSYRYYCNESGFRSVSKKTFSERLKNAGIETEKKNFGIIVYLKKVS